MLSKNHSPNDGNENEAHHQILNPTKPYQKNTQSKGKALVLKLCRTMATSSAAETTTERFVGVSHNNGVPKKLSHIASMRFEIHDFAHLPHQREEEYRTRPIRAHGALWSLRVYPRGCKDSKENFVSLDICREREDAGFDVQPPPQPIVVRTEVLVQCSPKWTRQAWMDQKSAAFPNERYSVGCKMGWDNFVSRECLLKFGLCNGSWVLTVKIQALLDSNPIWRLPKPSFPSFMAQLKESSEDFDVSFVVEGRQVYAHKAVLRLRAPALLELASTNRNEPSEISDVCSAEIFEDIIDYAYTGNEPCGYDDLEATLLLLVGADKVACTDLKMGMEANVVEKFLDETNAIRLLLFAESHTCALLTEAATELICQNHS